MFGVGIFVTFAQRYKLSGTTGIARGLPLKLIRNEGNTAIVLPSTYVTKIQVLF